LYIFVIKALATTIKNLTFFADKVAAVADSKTKIEQNAIQKETSAGLLMHGLATCGRWIPRVTAAPWYQGPQSATRRLVLFGPAVASGKWLAPPWNQITNIQAINQHTSATCRENTNKYLGTHTSSPPVAELLRQMDAQR
jgi:hypothetical protein